MICKKLKIIKKIPKQWKTKDGIIMPFFTQEEGSYEMVKIDDGWRLDKVFENPKERQSIFMYQKLYENLLNGGTILVDEDVLSLDLAKASIPNN